jgi:hypothetical protein
LPEKRKEKGVEKTGFSTPSTGKGLCRTQEKNSNDALYFSFLKGERKKVKKNARGEPRIFF